MRSRPLSSRLQTDMHLCMLVQALEVSQDAATFVDLDGQVVYANPAAGDLFGCRSYDVTGQFLWDMMDDPGQVAHLLEATLEHGQWRGEVGIIRDDTRMAIPWRTALIQARDGEILGVVGIGGALVSHTEMVTRLERFERQRLLGELAAGVAHNVNQILTVILGRAFLLQNEDLSQGAKDEIQKIVDAANQGAELVHRIQLGVMNGSAQNAQPIDVNQVAKTCMETARPKWQDEALRSGRNVDVVLDLKAAGLIAGHEGEVDGILMNLIFNAVDAMPEGGRIDIRTWDEADGVCVSVSDTGIGMDQHTKDRLGELFFTTKTDGHGIGLATCFRTLKDLSGRIEIESAPGKGSTFLLRFPVMAQVPVHSPLPEFSVHQPACKILVVDDEAPIRNFLLQALAGYQVDVAADGGVGLALFREKLHDVVFVDLSLPSISGIEIAQQIRQMHARTAVVLMTGWEMLPDEMATHFHAFLHKPFTLQKLHKLLDDLLGASDS